MLFLDIVNKTIYVFPMTSEYDASAFPPFAVTADVALFMIRDDALNVLLVKRGGEPYRDAWALPGGFVLPEEGLQEAAARELAEETGLAEGAWYMEQLAAFGAPGRDPRMRVVTVAFWAICAELPASPKAGGDAAKTRFEPVEPIESGALPLAFDHAQIVRGALEQIRSGMKHTALAARFCPPEFTIRHLRQVYETVWGFPLDPGNFQRFVRESGAFEQRGSAAPPPEMSARMPSHDTDFLHGVVPSAPVARDRWPVRGRPASLWAARKTDDGRPAMAARSIAGAGRPPVGDSRARD